MKRNLWIFGLVTLLSLMVSANASAYFDTTLYVGAVKFTNKIMYYDTKGLDVIQAKDTETFEGLMLLFTDVNGGPTNSHVSPLSGHNCFIEIYDPDESNYFINYVCIDQLTFVTTDYDKTGKTEKVQIIGSGFFGPAIDSGVHYRPFILECDKVSVIQNKFTDAVTSISTGPCKMAGGYSEQIIANDVIWGFNFSATFKTNLSPD